MADIDTTNKFMVGLQGDQLVVMRPIQRLSTDDALNLAAYLVAMAEEKDGDFARVLEAIQNA